MLIQWRTILALACGNLLTAAQNPYLEPAQAALDAPGISQILSPSYAGIGIEPTSLFDLIGYDSPNKLTINLMSNLANYTGVPPHIRLGGNSGDTIVYDDSQTQYRVRLNPNPVGQGVYASDLYTVGPTYFEALDRFPPYTPITYGLNMAYNEPDWRDRIVASASAALRLLKQTSLVSFEIGNEPDLYGNNGFRAADWNGQQYTGEWRDRAQTVYDGVLKSTNIPSNFFEPACTASTISMVGTTFAIDTLANDGILDPGTGTDGKSFVAAWNQHDYFYYLNVSSFTLTLDFLMDLSQTPNQFTAWSTQTQQAFGTGYPYVLREMASAGPRGVEGISDVFGATLWTLNFFLYTATLNVSSVEIHMTTNSSAAPWQAVQVLGEPPHVRSSYYAFAATAQLIGGSCTTRVAPLAITTVPSPEYENRLAAYATYNHDQLHAVVLLNTRVANMSQSVKPTVSFTVSLPSHRGETLYFSHLSAEGADATSGTTWNGVSYEQGGQDGMPVVVDSNLYGTVIGDDGTVTIEVADSSALVANFGSQLGTGAQAVYDRQACGALGAAPNGGEGEAGLPTYPGGDVSGRPGNGADGGGFNPLSEAAPPAAGCSLRPPGMLEVVLVSAVAIFLAAASSAV